VHSNYFMYLLRCIQNGQGQENGTGPFFISHTNEAVVKIWILLRETVRVNCLYEPIRQISVAGRRPLQLYCKHKT